MNFIWNRDPQEAMDNPYEYEAQDQFRRQAKIIVEELRNHLINKFGFSLDDQSFEKAIWMLALDSLDSTNEVIIGLDNNLHRTVARLLRAIDESIDLAFLLNTKNETAKKFLSKWFNDEIISHSEYRTLIKRMFGDEKESEVRNYYRIISKYSHGTYKTLLYSYILGRDNRLIHDKKFQSGILISPQTMAMYHAISGIYLDKVVNCIKEFNLLTEDEIQTIWKVALEDTPVPRKYMTKKKNS